MRGAAYPPIPPGGLSCHPGNTTDSGNQCVVLRFTTPRVGTYAVSAKAWNRNIGWTAVTLLVNGEVAVARKAWKSGATAVETNDFSLAAATYAAGDMIELAIDGNNTYNSNATGLDFKIAEEVEAVYDASSTFLANFFSEHSANPYTDAFGTWTAYCTTNYSGTFSPATAMRARLTTTTYRRVGQGDVLAGLAWNNGLPYLIANITDAMAVETNSAGRATTATGRAFLPGELDIFPAAGSYKSTILEVCPSEGGVYDIGLTVRDMFYSDPGAEDSGANVWLCGCCKVAKYWPRRMLRSKKECLSSRARASSSRTCGSCPRCRWPWRWRTMAGATTRTAWGRTGRSSASAPSPPPTTRTSR